MPPVESIPSARRLIKSLRDMGYDFTQAVADIVDNAVEAHARLIAVDIEFDGDGSWVRVADDGRGMKPDELREAMRYGSERDYDEEALGKFGLGLKTASMSQCQRLSVASRWNPDRADITAYSWDLAHVERTNRWEILPIERNGLGPAIREPLRDTPGTVVLWQRLDRILGYKHPYGELARKRLSNMCRELELHLGMVFHRFLSGEIRGRHFKILLNGNQVQPWDPFCRKEARTKALQRVTFKIEHEGVSGEMAMEPFILPPKEGFSSPQAFQDASGPNSWNQHQGFYFYRAGRLIQCGGWSNLRAMDEHIKLARIALFFPRALDEAFKINVAKMRVQLPSQIREEVRTAVGPVTKLARDIYDRKIGGSGRGASDGDRVVGDGGATGDNGGGDSVDETRREGRTGSTPAVTVGSRAAIPLLSCEQWAQRMLGEADEGERPIVAAVAERLLAKLGTE